MNEVLFGMHDEQAQLYCRIKKAQAGDMAEKEKLTEENMGLVYAVARRFYNRGYEQEDLHQLGAMGLLKAIQNFNSAYNVRFSTYAVPLIMGEIKCFIRDDGPIKVSRTIKQTAAEIIKVQQKVQQEEGRVPGVLEIAKYLKISPEEVIQAMDASMPPESFSAQRGDGNKTLADFLPDKDTENDRLDRLDLKNAILSLSPREQTIILMRYYFDKTQSDIAKKLGISQVQVSRLEKKILETVRKRLSCTS